MTKFTATDNIIDGGRVYFVGECEGDKLTRLDGVDDMADDLLIRRKEQGVTFATVDDLAKCFPRLTIAHDEATEEEEYGRGEIKKLDPAKKRVYGWAYVSHDRDGDVVVDKSGEFIEDVGVLEESAIDYVIKSRRGGTDHKRSHEDEVIHSSTMIESMVFTPEKIEKMGIPPGTRFLKVLGGLASKSKIQTHGRGSNAGNSHRSQSTVKG